MLSYYYTKADLSVRLAIFFTCNYWAGIITNFTAAGFIEMSGVLGYSGWRWMFLGQVSVEPRHRSQLTPGTDRADHWK